MVSVTSKKKLAILVVVIFVLLILVGKRFFYSDCDATYMIGQSHCECWGKKIDVTDLNAAAVDAAPYGETRCLGIVTSRTSPLVKIESH